MKTRAIVLAFLAPAFARAAFAQTDPVAAQALFDDARRLMAKNDFDAACPKLVESQRLDPGVGTLLNLGECWDKDGKTARAWATFRDAEAMALHEKQTARAQYASSRAAQIESRLARITIDVPADARVANLVVRRDGEIVREAAWGSAVPVDPGEHLVEAEAAGYKPFSARVDATTGTLVVHVTPLVAEPTAVAPPPVEATPPPQPIEPPPAALTTPPLTIDSVPRDAPNRAAPSTNGNALRVAGYAVGGVGIAGLALGGLFGVLAIGSNNTANQAGCNATTCPTLAALGSANDAKTYAVGSDVAFAIGGALVVTAIVLVAIAPRSQTARVARAIARGGVSF